MRTPEKSSIRLLEEIRDGQRLQLERQAQALERQDEALAHQRERLRASAQGVPNANAMGEEAQRLLSKAGTVVTGARITLLLALPIALSFVAFVVWALFANAVR